MVHIIERAENRVVDVNKKVKRLPLEISPEQNREMVRWVKIILTGNRLLLNDLPQRIWRD